MRLLDLLQEVPGAQVRGDVVGVEVSGLAYDSRRVRPGDLFMTWQGAQHDGHAFCREAIQRGAVACLLERAGDVPPEAVEVVVEDARAAMARVAAAFFGHPTSRLALVGITGTKGKTTTAFMVRQVLGVLGQVGLVGTVATVIGGHEHPASRTTPEAVDLQAAFAEMVTAGDRFCALEVSSHALELHRVDGCRFETGVFTNLGRDHLDFHGTIERYVAAKAMLFTEVERAVVANADDPWHAAVVGGAHAPLYTYGFGPDAQVAARDLALGADGSRFTVVFPGGSADVRLRLTGRFNVYNALAALAVGLVHGIDAVTAAEALSGLRGVPGRFELITGSQSFSVVVDYAHTPQSLEQVLATARELARGRVIVVFGAGGDRDRGKRPLMGRAAAIGADLVVLTSDNPRSEDPLAILRDVRAGVGGAACRIIPDREEAIRTALAEARPGDWVVIAGKGHETYQIFADRTLPFDDREVAAAALRSLGF